MSRISLCEKALHEAGHAVAALALGFDVLSICIHRKARGRVHAFVDIRPAARQGFLLLRTILRRQAIIAFAGHFAQHGPYDGPDAVQRLDCYEQHLTQSWQGTVRASGRFVYTLNGDYSRVFQVMKKLGYVRPRTRLTIRAWKWWRRVRISACRLVVRNWRAIERLTEALLQKRRLSGAEVQRLYRGDQCPPASAKGRKR